MNTRTETELTAIATALQALSEFGQGFPAEALVTAREAEAEGLAKVKGWPSECVLVRVGPLIEWASTLDGKTALALVNSELLMGWFEGDGDDPETEDDDGEFMSTPSVTEDERWPAEDLADALRHCEREGFISIG